LSLYRAQDYATAGVPMLPVVAGPESTRRHILVYTLLLVLLSLAPVALGFAGPLYGAIVIALGAGFLGFALRLWRDRSPRTAMRTFRFSIVYLFGLFGALVIDHAVGLGGSSW
jgi:protoheme IX farnesyltransferase